MINQNSYKNYEDLNNELEIIYDELESIDDRLNKLANRTKGLSIAINNTTIKSYAKPLEEYGKALKMKHIGRLFALMILYKEHILDKHVPFEYISRILELNQNVSHNRLKSDVRKALKELYPSVEYKEDPVKGIKFTHINKGANEGYEIKKNETRGFTQLYCDLLHFENDVIVLFTALEYFKGSSKEVYPSIDTLCKLTGCRKRDKINKLLQNYQVTEEENGLWKKISSKGGSKQTTNRYELSYVTEEGLERYYYLDYIEAELSKEKEKLLEAKLKLEQLIGVENIKLPSRKKTRTSVKEIIRRKRQEELLENAQ